jgi:hypothetical protein
MPHSADSHAILFRRRTLIFLFLVAAVLVCGGAAVYPVGWDNREVLESCGNSSSVYNLGKYCLKIHEKIPARNSIHAHAQYFVMVTVC